MQKSRWFCKTSILKWQNWPKHQFCQIAKPQMTFFFITANFIIQELKLWEIAQNFWVSVSLVRGTLRKFERIERKTKPRILGPCPQTDDCHQVLHWIFQSFYRDSNSQPFLKVFHSENLFLSSRNSHKLFCQFE